MKKLVNFKLSLLFLTLILFFTGNQVLLAQFGEASHVSASLISEVTSVQPGQSFWVAVRLNLDKGWHVYWRNPGDTGLETTIDWQLPEGFTAGEIKYPYPERIVEDPLVTYGYHGEIYLLNKIEVDPSVNADQTVTLKGLVSWLECETVCIPGEAQVTVQLPVKDATPQADEKWVRTFADARADLPLEKSDWQVSATTDEGQLIIQAVAPDWYKDALGKIYFFPYQTDIIQYAAKQINESSGGKYQITIPLRQQPQIPDTLKGVLVSENGWRGPGSEKAIEMITPVSSELTSVAGGGSELSSIWLAILFSFIGGIILNLMPCVLPVLSIKIMGFVNQAHDAQSQPWKHGIVFMFGVLISFWVLAAALLILKAGGAQLGWGFQLQSPEFIIFLAAFMFLFGLSMFGVFEIGTSLTTVGGSSKPKGGWTGSFVSGVTATIVATPCTAPFMGSALGFALTQPGWVSIVIFTFLGLGMAFPFVLVSSIPALIKFVPKPGRWMESLKQFMGFLLAATVVWLLWVLGIQAGANAVILVLLNLLLTALAAWIYGRWGNLAMPAKTRTISITLAVIILAFSNGYTFASVDDYAVKPQAAVAGKGIQWQPYTEEAVQTALENGEPVFIDFTAAWCLSCQVNEQVAFGSKEVQEKFKDLGVNAFKADWTSRDERITRALAKYGRNSVPLYVLYNGEADAKPQMLPEIITPGIILEALESI